MTSLKFHPAARREEDAAAGWYADQDQNAAIDFLEEAVAAYSRIATQPKQFPQYFRGTRRLILDRFPYSVIFREQPDAIEVIELAHAKRKPGYWAARRKSN